MAYNFLRQARSIRNSFLCVYDTLDGYSSNFHINGDVDGWDVYNGIYLYTCWNGTLFGSSYDRSPYIGRSINILPVSAEYYYTVNILMKITNNNPQKTVDGLTTGRIRWIRSGDSVWGSDKQMDFDIVDDDEWRLYTINMGPHQLWQGDISNLRIYPFIDGWGGDQFAIKYIKISSRDTYTCKNTQCSYYTQYTHPCPGGGQRGSCESGLQNTIYTTISGVSDKLALNINNYGVEYFDLGTNLNLTPVEISKVMANKIASVNVGGYAFVEVEYSELDRLKIYSGTVDSTSSVEVLDSTAARSLGFYDVDGAPIYTASNGVAPATGFDYASSRLMTALEINKLVDGNSSSFAYIHNPDQYNVEGGRRDFNEIGTSSLLSSISTGEYYQSLNNSSRTLIDLSHPMNNNGRIKTIYVYGKITTLSKVKIFRPKNDGTYVVIYSLDMPLEAGSYMYTTKPINYRVDCDILVEKGDVIGIYNADLYVGVTVNGRPDATFMQIVGDCAVGAVVECGTIYSFGVAGFAIYARGDRLQNTVMLDIDLGDRVNIEEMNIYGKEDSGEVEFNIASCLDVSWSVDLYGESHFHSGVNWSNGEPWMDTHLNKYYGKDCLDDCVVTADNGQQGTSYTSGADGMETYGPHAYFYVDGDAEWLYSGVCNGKTEYCNLMIPGSAWGSARTTAVGGFVSDPISFTLSFPTNVKATIHKSIMYFKERDNFRSVELSYYMGPYSYGGDAYKDIKFKRIPSYTEIKLDGLSHYPDDGEIVNEYLFKNPTNQILNYTIGGTHNASNWEEYRASLLCDWTILEHSWNPVECQGFRIYTNHHNSTKLLELELYSKIQTTASLIDNVIMSFSDYGDVWTFVPFESVSDNKISGFMGGAPRYIRLEFNSSGPFELNEVECLVGDQVKLPNCDDVILLDHAPNNKVGESTPVVLQNRYDKSFDLSVDIPLETTSSEDLVFWSKLNSYDDIIDPQIGPGCRLYKNVDYEIGNYMHQCAINTPAYGLKNIAHDKNIYEYLYDTEWTPLSPSTITSGVSLDYTNYVRAYYKESVLEFNPVSSIYWKFEHNNYMSLKDVFASYTGSPIDIDQVYYGGLKGTSNPVFTFNNNINIDAASSTIRSYYSDSFTGGTGSALNPIKWDTSGLVSIYGNKARLTANSSVNTSFMYSNHALAGDFNIACAWQLITYPSTNGWYLIFQIEDTASLWILRWQRYYVGSSYYNQLRYRDASGVWTTQYSSSAADTSGTINFVRVGNTVGGVGSYTYTMTNSPYRFRVYAQCTGSYPTFVADIDNYTISAGDVAVDVSGMKLVNNDPVDTLKIFHSPQSDTTTVIKTSTDHSNNYATWATATAPTINNQNWYQYLAIDFGKRHDIDIIRNYGTATNKLWLSTFNNVDYSNTETNNVDNVVWNNSTKDDVRWLRIKILMGDSTLRAIRKLGIYPDIGTAYSMSGGYNCDWYSLGYMLSDCYSPINVAYGAAVTGTNNYFMNFYPTNAVDGVSTDYSYQSCWGFDSSTGSPYLELDFGQLYMINMVKLYHGYDPDDSSYMNTAYNFAVSTSASGSSFSSVFSITGNTTFNRTHQFDPVYARRARLTITGYNSGVLRLIDPETNEYIIFNGSFLREIEVFTYTDVGYADSETWPVICMNLLDQFGITNHDVINKDIADTDTNWYNNDELFRYSDGYHDDPHKVIFNRNGSTVYAYNSIESSGNVKYTSSYIFDTDVYIEAGSYSLSWESYYNQSVGEISLIIIGPDTVEVDAQTISTTWASETVQIVLNSSGYYTIKAVQNVSEENNWGARYPKIYRTAGLTKWISVKCDTATNYSWDNDSDKYGIDYLTLLKVYGDTSYRPTEYSWWWDSNVSDLSNDYLKVKIGSRSLKIAYPDSTILDTVQFLEGDSFGKDLVFSAKDALHLWLYIDDVSKLDTSVGDISFGVINSSSPAYYSWYLSNMSLVDGWNDLNLRFELPDYTYPASDDADVMYGHLNEVLDFRTNDRHLNSIRLRYKGVGNAFNMYVDDIKIKRNVFDDDVKFGKGLCLTGYDYLDIPLAGLTLERGAIEFWIKLYTTSYGLDVFGDMNSRSLFTMVNNNNDIISLGIQSGGWFSPSSGHLRRLLNSFEIDTDIIPNEYSFEINDVVHIAIVWSNDGKYMDNGDTMRLYVNGEKAASSNVAWEVGDTKSTVVRLGGATTQLALNRDSFGSSIFNNIKIYNYCKTEFNPNEEGILKDKVYTPNDFIQISADNINFYGIGSDQLPITFSQVPSGESRTVYIRTNKNEDFVSCTKLSAPILIQWLTTV